MNDYATPRQLQVSAITLRRVLLIGDCIFDSWIDAIGRIEQQVELDHRSIQQAMDGRIDFEAYDFSIVQVALRAIYPEYKTMPLKYNDLRSHEDLFQRARELITHYTSAISQKSSGAPTFFLNYMLPQQNPLGRLLPRYDLRNPVYFIEELNRVLYEVVSSLPNSHVIDIAQLGGMFGRRLFQDDAFWLIAHGSFIGDYDHGHDQDRLEPSQPITRRYALDIDGAIETFWNEAVAMHRTLCAADRVKMLCVDLDDTLWRGVLAEQDDVDPSLIEGWPIGLAEALTILMRRGVILAIVSKNDERRVQEIWPRLFGDNLKLADFAIRKIGWRSKADSIAEAIVEANVLPDSVVFLDDNPAERAHVKSAHPLVRVIEAPHTDWRRILLWSPEFQVSAITDESMARNEMIKAQGLRESDRAAMANDDFLGALDLEVEISAIVKSNTGPFERSLELLNKTNQFNTTGRRWSRNDAEAFFERGGIWRIFKAHDRYTHYGIVGVIAVEKDEIVQFVMSCRVFGLGLEQAVLAVLSQKMRLSARIITTSKNGPCQSVFEEGGWTLEGDLWSNDTAKRRPPEHVKVTLGGLRQAKRNGWPRHLLFPRRHQLDRP